MLLQENPTVIYYADLADRGVTAGRAGSFIVKEKNFPWQGKPDLVLGRKGYRLIQQHEDFGPRIHAMDHFLFQGEHVPHLLADIGSLAIEKFRNNGLLGFRER